MPEKASKSKKMLANPSSVKLHSTKVWKTIPDANVGSDMTTQLLGMVTKWPKETQWLMLKRGPCTTLQMDDLKVELRNRLSLLMIQYRQKGMPVNGGREPRIIIIIIFELNSRD